MPDGDRAAERAGRDSVTVLALLAVGVDSAALLIKGGPRPALLALAGAAAGVVISWRRPRRGLAVTVIACAGSILAGWDPTALWTVAVFTVFTATLAGVSALIVGGTVAVALYLLIAFWEDASLSAPAAVIASVTAIAAAGIGGALRAQLRYWTVVEQRAADAIAARQQEIDREVVEDRLRIARDLHDLIGHEVAVLNMQLGVAEVSLPEPADQARAAVHQARAAVQSILQETQQILALLRADSVQPAELPPGPDRFHELLASYRRIGLEVSATIDDQRLAGATPAVSTKSIGFTWMIPVRTWMA